MGPVARPRVLVADDYPRLIAAINRLLGEHACEVVGTATDGVQLLEEAVRLQPDVVLLDLFMPKLNGLDACLELGRLLPRAKIVVLTADADPDIRRAALAAGASAVVDKLAIATDLLPAITAAWDGPDG
jgi:DNA-binding NarL/FixJ family response regulator